MFDNSSLKKGCDMLIDFIKFFFYTFS
ncbi:hypothetical protein NVIE_0290 [Nitrososphaera viennensis EN76]|uniref:Uncharacterized protein n=1 Tax=Nitrososphaera viennensis EN76 TaxID=926571 RepID=A0A060HGL5_9ARCH|nr:hypothetical protein NVIE_0290 [Nitrososphaera viennensis EN76]